LVVTMARQRPAADSGITRICAEGYKSLRARQAVDIRPLTVIAGVNSSGKSSAIQPLLLLKQTLDSSYDPGPLLLSGPRVVWVKPTEPSETPLPWLEAGARHEAQRQLAAFVSWE
jgi:hypothetical protein